MLQLQKLKKPLIIEVLLLNLRQAILPTIDKTYAWVCEVLTVMANVEGYYRSVPHKIDKNRIKTADKDTCGTSSTNSTEKVSLLLTTSTV